MQPDEPAELVCNRCEPGDVVRWSMRNLDAGPGYAAAVVFERVSVRTTRALQVASLPPDIDAPRPQTRIAA